MIAPCEPKTSLKKVLKIIFFFTFVGILLISFLGIAAFGGQMVVIKIIIKLKLKLGKLEDIF